MDISSLPFGDNIITITLFKNNNLFKKDTLILTKLPPKANEVKINKINGLLYVRGKRFYPFGFYCYSPVQKTLPAEEVTRGFNLFSPYQHNYKKTIKERKAYMDRCAQLGMKVNYHLAALIGGGGVGSKQFKISDKEKEKLLENEIKTFKNHPALLAWYINDEPVGQGVSVSYLEKMYKKVKELDPYHPVSIVFMTPSKAKLYKNAMDIVMADPYPMPGGTVVEVEQVTKLLKHDFYFDKPVWIVPQAFGGNEMWEREPTPDELYIMTYLAIANGATGIQYFIRHGYNSFPKSTIAWSKASQAALENIEIIPFIEKNDSISTEYNDSLTITKYYKKDSVLILILNKTNSPVEYLLPKKNLPSDTAFVLFKNRNIMAKNNNFKIFIEGYSVKHLLFRKNKTHNDYNNIFINGDFESIYAASVPAGCYVNIGKDRGANYFVTTEEAYTGNHSLKITNPCYKCSPTFSFKRRILYPAKSYYFSFYAKGYPTNLKTEQNFFEKLFSFVSTEEKEKLQVRIKLSNIDTLFEVDSSWKKYEFFLSIPETTNVLEQSTSLNVYGQGTFFIDNIKLIEDPIITTTTIDKKLLISIKSKFKNLQFKYSLDNKNFKKLTNDTIVVDSSTFLTLYMEKNNKIVSKISKKCLLHKAVGENITYLKPYSPRYPGYGDRTLIDGLTAGSDFRDKNYLGFEKNNLDVLIVFRKPVQVNKISIKFLQNIAYWIFLPKYVKIGLSEDNINYHYYTIKNSIPAQKRDVFSHTFSFKINSQKQFKYLKVFAKNLGICPKWHRGYPGNCWLFTDEIIVE